ncbi:MAG: T9SS type A sorting domain-containing protein, partial [Bacteroidales bacterium]|nr:T9SS type A sorting domain-containing protein [Bacteroidales bacterium]
MKNHYIILVLLLLTQEAGAQDFKIISQHCYGGSYGDYPVSIIPKGDGFIICGSTYSHDGDISFNPSSDHEKGSYWLLETDDIGQIVWERTYGGSESDGPTNMLQTPDGGYLLFGDSFSSDGDVGGNQGGCDFWLIKTDSVGNPQWEQNLGGSMNDMAYQIAPTPDGGYICTGMAGSSDGDVSFNHGQYDVWVVKLSAEGMLEWERCYGGISADQGNTIIPTTDGGYIVAGMTSSHNGDVQCSGPYITNAWVLKLDAQGEIEWQQCYGGSHGETAADIIQTGEGGYIFVGAASSNDGDVSGFHGIHGDYSTADMWAVKLDANGLLEWQLCLGGSGFDNPIIVRQLEDGGFLVGGMGTSSDGDAACNPFPGSFEVILYKLSANGVLLWSKCLGSQGYNTLQDVFIYSPTHFLLGATARSVDTDVDCTLHGQTDFWIVDIMDTTVSLREEKKQEILLYPNPATNQTWLQLPENTALAKAQIELYSFSGRLLHKAKPSSHFYKIDVAHLPKGLYLVRLWDGK